MPAAVVQVEGRSTVEDRRPRNSYHRWMRLIEDVCSCCKEAEKRRKKRSLHNECSFVQCLWLDCATRRPAIQWLRHLSRCCKWPTSLHCRSIVYGYSSSQCKIATLLRELTCHTASHSVTCYPAEVIFLPLPQTKVVLDLTSSSDCKTQSVRSELLGFAWNLTALLMTLTTTTTTTSVYRPLFWDSMGKPIPER